MSQDRPYKIKCRCGQKEFNFKNNIGEFFISECCTIAGYDHLGLKKGEKPVAPAAPKAEPKAMTPTEALDQRKAEKEALNMARASEIAKRKAERDARAQEKAANAKKLEQGPGSDETPG